MNNDDKRYLQIENDAGEVEVAEIICTIKSEKEDKEYVILTQDEEIGDEVNVIIGILKDENGEKTFIEVEDDEEFNYVVSLMDKIEKGEML